MAFDLATAKPVEEKAESSGFDLSTAKPVEIDDVGGGRGKMPASEYKAPKVTKKPGRYKPTSDSETFESAGKFLGDIATSGSQTLERVGQSILEMVPGGKSLIDKPGLQEREKHLMDEDPAAAYIGKVLPSLPSIGATGMPVAAGAMGRIAQSAALGGVTAVASNPVEGDKTGAELAKAKGEQAKIGAAIGGLFTGAAEGVSKLKEVGAKLAFGPVADKQKQLWDRAKNMGFQVRPDQAREDSARMMQPGLTDKDKLANKLVGNKTATAPTGRTSNTIDSNFLDERFKSLGKEFDQIYKPGTKMTVDIASVQELKDLIQSESKIGQPFMTTKATQAAKKITDALDAVQSSAGVGRVTSIKIDAEDIQRLRTELQNAASSTGDKIDRANLYSVVNAIDESVSRNHPQLASKLDVLRPKYRTLVTLDNAAKKGIIDVFGNVSPADLGSYLRKNDIKYTRGTSTHPLAELGEIGETFGIRGIGQASISGGQGQSGRQLSEELPSTRAGMWRMGKEYAMAAPGVRGMHEKYLKGKYRGGSMSSDDAAAVGYLSNIFKMQDDERPDR